MHNRHNEFVLIIYIAQRKMADFEHRELKIRLEFRRLSFAKRNNFSKGPSEPKKCVQEIRVRGRITCFGMQSIEICRLTGL